MSEAPEAAVIDTGAEAVVEEAAPSWAPSQDEWQSTQQTLQSLSAWAQQRAAEEAQRARPDVPRPDPFADDFHEQLDRYIEAKTAPFAQTHQQLELQAGEDLAYDIIADNIARDGDFLYEGSKQLAFNLSRSFLPQAIQRHGYSDRAGEEALEMACKHVRELEGTIGKAYHERQMNQLGTLAGATGEPGAAGGATQITRGPYGQGQRVTDRFFGNG